MKAIRETIDLIKECGGKPIRFYLTIAIVAMWIGIWVWMALSNPPSL